MTVSIHEIPNRAVRPHEGAILFDDGGHRWAWLGHDTEESDDAGVAANQYLIEDQGRGCILDPGSILEFASTVSNVARFIEPERLDYLFFSHQDPDVASGIALWAGCTPARFLMPSVWARFLPHFGEFEQSRAELVPDRGMSFTLGRSTLKIIPAHYLHSVGNITLYDPVSRFLFTGDIGAALLPPGREYLFVEDFRAHLPYMEGFHRRYMVSGAACRDYVARVSSLPIEAIVPQHGAIFRGADVRRFFDWFASLKCGVDLLDELYHG